MGSKDGVFRSKDTIKEIRVDVQKGQPEYNEFVEAELAAAAKAEDLKKLWQLTTGNPPAITQDRLISLSSGSRFLSGFVSSFLSSGGRPPGFVRHGFWENL